MASIRLPAVVLLFGLLIAGCDGVINLEDQDELVTAEVHLQQGFQAHWVSAELNGDVHFQARLDTLVPLAGPLAVFRLDVPRGTHQLLIRWVPTDGDRQACMSMVDLWLDQAELFYVGLLASEGSVQVTVQEGPFEYI